MRSAVVVFLAACASSRPPEPAAEVTPEPPATVTVAPDPTGRSWPITPMSERDLPDGVTATWLKAACDLGPCNGPTSRAVVLRDTDGAAKRLYLLGDFHACSHSPAYYVDPDGTRVGVIAERPVEAGETFESLHGAYRDGLVEAETVRDPCRGHD